MSTRRTVITAGVGKDDTEAVEVKQSDDVYIGATQLTSGRVDIDRKQPVISPLTGPRWPLDSGDDVRDFQPAADAVDVTRRGSTSRTEQRSDAKRQL